MLFLPVTTVVLGGFRSPPFDLVRRPLTKEQSERRVTLSLVALGGVASLVIALSFAKHFGSCGGVLIEVPEPKTAWRALPIIARGDEKYSLGPFNVRGHKDNYKGYPSVIQQATLSDPRLCFASTVSLEPWFDGRYGYHLYRRADELELRHDPKTRTFVVTGNGYPTSDVRTGFVVAFRRDETKRYWFDHPEAASHQFFAIGFLFIGGVSLALFRLRDDRPRGEFAFLKRDYRWMYPRVAYLAFLVAFASPLVLAFQLIEAPRPGAELVEHVISP
jgi:hypothetical protein